MSLRERATAAAAPAADDWPEPTRPGGGAIPTEAASAELPDIEYTGAITDADQVAVHTAWARVMADVQSVSKDDKYNGNGTRYDYRGIDRVLNAVGPALRRHGVMVIPVRTEAAYRDTTTSRGNKMRECTVTVTYSIRGPKGDEMPAQACGEALDTSDKTTTKACTVAYRNMLITALSIPTRDPRLDAEASNHERGEERFDPLVYRDEALRPGTSVGRLSQMINDLRRLNRGAELVANEVGEDEKLGNLLWRIRRERAAPAADEPAEVPGGDR